MTNNTNKKGQFAPESKHPVVGEMEKSAHLIGAVVASTIRFAVIFLCAVALGHMIHWADHSCEYVPDWMIQVGHYVEYGVYGIDIAGFCWSVGLHFLHYIVSEWKEFRKANKEHDE